MDFKTKTSQLENGLKVVRVPMNTDSVTVMCLVKAGSRWETPSTNGLSHFLEHMVFKGTKKYSSAFKIASAIDAIGAEFNAFTSKEQTAFYVKSALTHLDLALDMVSQLVFSPLIPAQELEKERGTIVEEINMYQDNPMVYVSRIFPSLVFGNTSLGWQVIGKKKNVRTMQKSDFVNYMSRFYQPANMVLVLAGGQKNGGNLIKKYFGQSKKTKKEFENQANIDQFPQTEAVKIVKKPTQQAHFCLGVKSYAQTHPDRYVLAVLATILGKGMSSRLFTEIREKRGLAYYVRTQKESFLETGYLTSQAGTDLKKTDEAIKVMVSEYQKISQKLAKDQELKKAKEYLKGHLILSMEDSKEVAHMIGDDLLLEGKIRSRQKILKAIDAVSAHDVKRVAQDIFKPENLKLALIGPFDDLKKFDDILKSRQ